MASRRVIVKKNRSYGKDRDIGYDYSRRYFDHKDDDDDDSGNIMFDHQSSRHITYSVSHDSESSHHRSHYVSRERSRSPPRNIHSISCMSCISIMKDKNHQNICKYDNEKSICHLRVKLIKEYLKESLDVEINLDQTVEIIENITCKVSRCRFQHFYKLKDYIIYIISSCQKKCNLDKKRCGGSQCIYYHNEDDDKIREIIYEILTFYDEACSIVIDRNPQYNTNFFISDEDLEKIREKKEADIKNTLVQKRIQMKIDEEAIQEAMAKAKQIEKIRITIMKKMEMIQKQQSLIEKTISRIKGLRIITPQKHEQLKKLNIELEKVQSKILIYSEQFELFV